LKARDTASIEINISTLGKGAWGYTGRYQ